MGVNEATELYTKLGLTGLIAVLAFIIILMWVRSASKTQESYLELSEDTLKSRKLLEAELLKVTAEKFILERRFTKCREELAILNGHYEALETAQQNAIEVFLDDTQGQALLHKAELLEKDKVIAAKETEIVDLQSQIQALNVIIANLKLKAK